MRLRFLVALVVTAIGTMVACGGSEGGSLVATSVPTAPTGRTPAPTSAPSTTVVPTQPPVTGTGTALDKAINVPLKEEDNVRYGNIHRYSSTRMGGNVDTKYNNSTTISREWKWVYEKLVGWEPNDNDSLSHLAPSMAESWSASADLKTYTFKIREGIKWQNVPPVNGRQVVANDAVVSLNRYREPDATAQPNWAQVDKIEAPDPRTVVIKLKAPNAWALNDLFGALEAVVPPELIDKYKNEAGGAIRDEMIGTGPFITKNYRFRVGSEYVRNPDYWRKDSKGNKLPYLDGISMKFIEDAATASAAFRTGQVDHQEQPVMTQETIIEVTKQIPNMRIISTGVLITSGGFAFNSKNAPWNNVNVRRAINMSFDRQRYMALQGKLGLTFVWHGIVPPNYIKDGLLTQEDFGPYYKFNPTEAKKLLIAAGFPDGKMKVSTPWPNGSEVIQQMLKEQGIEVPIQTYSQTEFGLFYYNRSHKDIMGTFKNSGDSGLNWYAQNKFHPDASENTAFIDDPKINELIKELKTVTDPAREKQIARILWDFDIDQSYYIWYPALPAFYVTQPRVRNMVFRSAQQFIGLPLMPWHTDAPRTSP